MATHQRARIHAAMIELAAERGYRAVTVRDVAQLAGVSTRTFYEHFADKEECFLCTYELVVARARQRIGAAQRGCRDWQERLRLAFGALVRESDAARLALVEAVVAGEPARARMRRARATFEAMVGEGFKRAPDGVPVPALVAKGIVGGVERVARARVLDGREQELPGLADELVQWTLSYRCEAVPALGQLGDPDPPARPDARAAALDGPTDERACILEAVARLSANEGYTRLSTPRIRTAAGVSRKSFDAHFDDVQACFMAALEHRTARALRHATRAGAAGEDWPEGLCRTLGTLMECLARDPVLARMAFVEVLASGPAGMRYCDQMIGDVAQSFRVGAPLGARPSELAAEAAAGAIWEIVHYHVVMRQTGRLPRVAPVLAFLALAPAVGGQAAIETIAGGRAKVRAGRRERHAPVATPY